MAEQGKGEISAARDILVGGEDGKTGLLESVIFINSGAGFGIAGAIAFDIARNMVTMATYGQELLAQNPGDAWAAFLVDNRIEVGLATAGVGGVATAIAAGCFVYGFAGVGRAARKTYSAASRAGAKAIVSVRNSIDLAIENNWTNPPEQPNPIETRIYNNGPRPTPRPNSEGNPRRREHLEHLAQIDAVRAFLNGGGPSTVKATIAGYVSNEKRVEEMMVEFGYSQDLAPKTAPRPSRRARAQALGLVEQQAPLLEDDFKARLVGLVLDGSYHEFASQFDDPDDK